MTLDLESEISEVKDTVRKVRNSALIKKAKGIEGKLVKELLSLLDLQLGMLSATAEKVNVAIEARDMTICHLGEQLMELRSRDAKPFFVHGPSNAKKDPGLYRPDMDISDEKRECIENDMYMEMARLSLGMGGGANALGISEDEFEAKIKEVADGMKNQANLESAVRKKVLDLIEENHKHNVPKEKTTEFLIKKKVPLALIQECFSEFDESLSFDGSDEEDLSDSVITPSVSCSTAGLIGLNSRSETEFAELDRVFTPRLPRELNDKFSPRSATSPAALNRELSSKANYSL